MPFAHLKVAGPRLTPDQIRNLQTELTNKIGTVLGKKTNLTAVLIQQLPSSHWAIGSKAVEVAAHLEVEITDGTNTAVEKMAFIADANALLRAVLGETLPLETYVVLKELPAQSWGYGGLTQDYRRQAITTSIFAAA